MSEDSRLEPLRSELAKIARATGEDEARFLEVIEEIQPFDDAVARFCRDADESAARELRSVAWLLAYRVGDRGLSALALEALLRAWAAHNTREVSDALTRVRDLLTDGFARGREDRCCLEVQRRHADSLPLLTLAPGARMLVLCDPLDADGAERVADRVGAELLRSNARALLIHLLALSPRLDVLAPLWSLASSARMLGCACLITGARAVLQAAIDEGALPGEPVVFIDDETEAVNALVTRAGGLVGALPAPLRWMRRRRGASSE